MIAMQYVSVNSTPFPANTLNAMIVISFPIIAKIRL